MKVWSLKNNGTDRKVYTNQTHTIMTDNAGNATVQGTAGTKDYDFVKLDEDYPQNQNPTLATLIQEYNARKHKVFITATVNGATIMSEVLAPGIVD